MQKDFSYPLKIEDLGQGEQNYTLKADKEQLEFIKDILQVPAVNSFEASIKLKFRKKLGELRVWGEVKSQIGQISVISLEEFNKEYKSSFEIVYDTNATYEQIREQDVDIMADVPDIVINGEINLADIAIEQIALVLDDYPRKEGEVFDQIIEDVSPIRNTPFAILETLKKK